MTDHQPLIDRLEALVDRNNRPDWEDVVRRAEEPGKAARPARRSRRSYLARRVVPVFVLAAAALAIALIAPWGHGRSFTGSAVAERALVAIGSGPVLHVVLRQETDSSYIDLASGQERPAADIEEIWYDSERHFEHLKDSSELIPDSESHEILQTPTGTWASYDIDPGPHTPIIDPALSEFFDGYRSALENGNAHVTGRGTIDGHDVTWIEFAVKLGCTHAYQACTERVAIDKASSLPLEIEWLRKGKVASTIEIASIAAPDVQLFRAPRRAGRRLPSRDGCCGRPAPRDGRSGADDRSWSCSFAL